ncbi:MAG: hypothetical protein C5B43_01165 [Verrucomicrobia bacterium]|nr:MAG: hypothetical protein C5B43_01165 [Verrucomicrobiota bacterium]
MFEEIVLSRSIIIYFFSLFLIGFFTLIYNSIKKRKIELNVQLSQESWINFCLLIWSLLMIMFFVEQLFFKSSSLLPKPWNQVTLGFIMQLATLFFIILSTKFFPRLFGFPINSKTASILNAIKEGILSFLEALPLIFLIALFWSFIPKIWNFFGITVSLQHQELVELFLQSNSKWFMITIILFGTIIAPITEEIIFRGGIYRFLKSKINPLFALTISAVIFAWIHNNLLSFLPLVLMGLLLARSYEKTGHILTPIVFHSLFNANTLVLLLLSPNFTLLHS